MGKYRAGLTMGGVMLVAWYAMEAVHEAGHALAGLVSGGIVRSIHLPIWGFSRTFVDPNPSPRIEVWAGPLAGAALPVALWALLRSWLHARPRCRWVVLYFAGFCLLANGAYLGFGWLDRVGDTGELLRLGVRPWQLMAVSLPMLIGGLACWHRLGPRFGIGTFTDSRSMRQNKGSYG